MIQWLTHHVNEPHLYFETSAILITLILFGKYLKHVLNPKQRMHLASY